MYHTVCCNVSILLTVINTEYMFAILAIGDNITTPTGFTSYSVQTVKDRLKATDTRA